MREGCSEADSSLGCSAVLVPQNRTRDWSMELGSRPRAGASDEASAFLAILMSHKNASRGERDALIGIPRLSEGKRLDIDLVSTSRRTVNPEPGILHRGSTTTLRIGLRSSPIREETRP